MPFTEQELNALPQIISTPRFNTYLNAAGGDRLAGLQLYLWNVKLSSAFIVPLQVCEVAARNGVVLALENTYQANWYTDRQFIRSLPVGGYYQPRKDLQKTSGKLRQHNKLTAGKVVADLKFVFWENMLTARHDNRLWNPHFRACFPNADLRNGIQVARAKAHDNLEKIRGLRNRIAHHEPIFNRQLQDDYDRIIETIHWRCNVSAGWVQQVQTVTQLLGERPIP